MKNQKIEYALFEDDDDDFLTPLEWPEEYAKRPAYALLRPLAEYDNPWRKSSDAVIKYLNSQARRMGGRYYVKAYLAELSTQAVEYPALHEFLLNPLGKNLLSKVLPELENFLRSVFASGEIYRPSVSNTQYLANIEGCFNKSFIEEALKECPELLGNAYNEDFTKDILSSPVSKMCLMLYEDYLITKMPVVLGGHYVSAKAQKLLKKKGHEMHRILGCYARWDSASVALHHKTARPPMVKKMHKEIKEEGFVVLGEVKTTKIDKEDYVVLLLVEADFPSNSITVKDWEINCPELTIIKIEGTVDD
jgi:hypothetical protein